MASMPGIRLRPSAGVFSSNQKQAMGVLQIGIWLLIWQDFDVSGETSSQITDFAGPRPECRSANAASIKSGPFCSNQKLVIAQERHSDLEVLFNYVLVWLYRRACRSLVNELS